MPLSASEQAVESERQLINLMLSSKFAVKEAIDSGVLPEHFGAINQPLVQAIYEEFKTGPRKLTRDNYRDRWAKRDKRQVLVYMDQYDACVHAVADANDLGRHIKAVRNGYAMRGLRNAAAAMEEGMKAGETGAAIATRMSEILSEAAAVASQRSEFVSAADIAPQKVAWLWYGRIAIGKTNLISGEGGVGKGALTMDLASRVTTGTPMPVTGDVVKGSVLILSAEDDAADTIVPRLLAAKADLSKVQILRSVISLDTDLAVVEAAIKKLGDVKLVIIDPISAFTGKTRDEEVPVRGFLRPIERLAQQNAVAVILVKHFKKGAASAKERVSGSVAWVNAARVAIGVSPDKDDESTKHLYRIKGNNSREVASLTYRTVPSAYDPEVVAVEWGGETTYRADDFCGGPDGAGRSRVKEAQDIITEALASGPMDSDEIQQLLENRGISRQTMWRAKDAAGIKARKAGRGKWQWLLPATEGTGYQPGFSDDWK